MNATHAMLVLRRCVRVGDTRVLAGWRGDFVSGNARYRELPAAYRERRTQLASVGLGAAKDVRGIAKDECGIKYARTCERRRVRRDVHRHGATLTLAPTSRVTRIPCTESISSGAARTSSAGSIIEEPAAIGLSTGLQSGHGGNAASEFLVNFAVPNDAVLGP